jgi:hypothetical protein
VHRIASASLRRDVLRMQAEFEDVTRKPIGSRDRSASSAGPGLRSRQASVGGAGEAEPTAAGGSESPSGRGAVTEADGEGGSPRRAGAASPLPGTNPGGGPSAAKKRFGAAAAATVAALSVTQSLARKAGADDAAVAAALAAGGPPPPMRGARVVTMPDSGAENRCARSLHWSEYCSTMDV